MSTDYARELLNPPKNLPPVSQPDYAASLVGFSETEGGAATGVIRDKQGRADPLTDSLTSIGGATIMGGSLGAAAPEILTGLAGLARQVPQGARVAPLLESAAIATKAAGRPASTIAGAASGLASETAGQLSDVMGGGPVTGEVVRFAAGGIGPEGLVAAKEIARRMLSVASLSVENKAKKELAREILKRLEGNPKDLTQVEADYLNGLVSDLRGGPKSDVSLRGIYDVLQTGAKNTLAVAENEAQTIIRNAQRAIERETQETLKGPVAYSRSAADRIARRGEDALATAQLQRFNIGNDLDASDIGAGLRTTIVNRNKEGISSRASQFKADEAARNAIVQQKESSGEFVEQLPEYKALVADLQKNLLIGGAARQQTTAPVTEQGVLRAYQSIYDAVTRRRVQTGVNAEGNPTYKEFPTSFEALDDVRRRLGTVFSGKPAEGYDAISADMARKYYAQISEIQKKFGGEPQERLLKNYADATEGLEMFGSRTGRKITALDRYDDSQFQTDSSAIPRQFFASKRGVNDLLELTGDRAKVVTAAKDFATNELRDMDAKQVRAWMTKRRDLLYSLPEVRSSVIKYADSLERGEIVARSAETAKGRLQAYERDRLRELESKSGDITRRAEQSASRTVTAAEAQANQLSGQMGAMFPAQNVKALIQSGSTKQWEVTAPLILASPNGGAMFADAVRQTLAEKATQSTKGLSVFFENKIRPALQATKIMPEPQINQIATQLSAIENMKFPEEQKLGIARRVILQAFGGYAASVSDRGNSALLNLIPQ